MKKKYTIEALKKLLERAIFYGFYNVSWAVEEKRGVERFIHLLEFCDDVDLHITASSKTRATISELSSCKVY